jgi:undecaprenyl-diphosphatase
MDDYLLSALLGIIEGLTEFLPVSSTAHLRIAEQVFGLDLSSGYWKMYAIVIQLGAILCLPIYFRKRIAQFLSTFPQGERGDRTLLTHPLTLVMIAFVVTAIPAFLLTKLIGKHLENLALMAWALIIGGIIMWIVDALFSKKYRVDHMEQISLGQAIWIGACQVLSAVFPGTSRSMSTIAAGQIAGMSREAALEFSFFLSMPTMAAATLYDLLKFLRHGGMTAMNGHKWMILLIGFVVSFLVAWGVVAWFMRWVRRHGFVPFAVYRILAGIVVLVWLSRLVYR